MKVHENKKNPSRMSSPNCVWVGSILDQGLTIKLRSVFLLRKGTSSSGHSGLIKHMHIMSDHPNDFPFFPFSRPNIFFITDDQSNEKILLSIVVPNKPNVSCYFLFCSLVFIIIYFAKKSQKVVQK